MIDTLKFLSLSLDHHAERYRPLLYYLLFLALLVHHLKLTDLLLHHVLHDILL